MWYGHVAAYCGKVVEKMLTKPSHFLYIADWKKLVQIVIFMVNYKKH